MNHNNVLVQMDKFDECIQTMSKELSELRSLYESQRKKIMQDGYEFEVFTVYKRTNKREYPYHDYYAKPYLVITKETYDYFQGKLDGFKVNTMYEDFKNPQRQPIYYPPNCPTFTDENKHMFYINENPHSVGLIDKFKNIFPDRDFYIKNVYHMSYNPQHIIDVRWESHGENNGKGYMYNHRVEESGYSFTIMVKMPVPPLLVNLMDQEINIKI